MAEKKEITTALSEWQKAYTGLVTRDFAECGVDFTDASKNCCMNAMVSIWNLIKDSGKKPEQFDTSSIKQALGQLIRQSVTSRLATRNLVTIG